MSEESRDSAGEKPEQYALEHVVLCSHHFFFLVTFAIEFLKYCLRIALPIGLPSDKERSNSIAIDLMLYSNPWIVDDDSLGLMAQLQ